MATENSGKKVDRRKAKAPSERQMKVVKARAGGKTCKESGIFAGYPAKNAAQFAYQAMKGLRRRVADLLDNAGLSEQFGIKMYSKPALEATETINAQKVGKFKDERDVATWHRRIAALRTLFELPGSYAPRDSKKAVQHGVKIINVDIPQPLGEFNQFIDVIPESALSRHRPTSSAKPAVPALLHKPDQNASLFWLKYFGTERLDPGYVVKYGRKPQRLCKYHRYSETGG